MATDIDLIVLPSTLQNNCFNSMQDMANAIAGSMRVLLPGSVGFFVSGSSEPTVEQRPYVWFKTDAASSTIVGIYKWSPIYGYWLQNHWQYNGGTYPVYERRIFVGTLTQLETYDGGEAGTVSDTTGPFWERDTAMNDMVPLGVGTAPITTVATSAAVFDDATPGDPKCYGVYFVKPTGRIYDRGN